MTARLTIVLASIALAAVIAFSAALILRSCALRTSLLPASLAGYCPPNDDAERLARLEALRERQATLQREIVQAERELAAIPCQASYPVQPEIAPEPAGIDEAAWQAGDVGLLEGCWSLDSNYRVENIATGAITEYNQWRMCFDRAGQGRATMSATNGTTCEGGVAARFDGDGRLIMEESANLICSDNSYIYKRQLACSLAGDGWASCDQQQNEVGRSISIRLRAIGQE